MAQWLIAITCFMIVGCATPKPIEIIRTVKVDVPVPVIVKPPIALATTFAVVAVPQFVPPSHANASSALTKEGEQAIKQLILDLYQRVRSWEAWGRELDPKIEDP